MFLSFSRVVGLFLLVQLAQSALWAAAPRVYLDERMGPHVERIVGIAKGEFQRAALLETARVFAREFTGSFRTGTLWIVTSDADSEWVQGVRATDGLYVAWRRDWLRLYQNPFPVARVVSIGESVRLEWRMADGQIGKELLTPRDPLVFSSDGVGYEIGYLLVRELRGLRGEGPVEGYQYTILISCPDRRRRPLREKLMRELSALTGAVAINAWLRPNTWFRHENIPIVYPFAVPLIPPASLRDADGGGSWCELEGGSVRCG